MSLLNRQPPPATLREAVERALTRAWLIAVVALLVYAVALLLVPQWVGWHSTTHDLILRGH